MKQLTQSIRYGVEDGIAVVVCSNPPVNAFSSHARSGVIEALKLAEQDPGVKAMVVYCDGSTFFAGADINEFAKDDGVPRLFKIHQMIDVFPKPIIAGIHGNALGGGFEFALASHYRIARPGSRFGLTEVTLGLCPGAGGTVRLPRIIGVKRALEMITSGSTVGAEEALKIGLVDAIVEGDLKARTMEFARQVLAGEKRRANIRDMTGKLAEARDNPALFADFRKSMAKRTRGLKAPEVCVQAVESAIRLPFDEAIVKEREFFDSLNNQPEAKALQHAFFAERQVTKIPDVPKDTPRRKIATVGVLGAGTMGGGIAMNYLNQGVPVRIVETAQEALDRGLGVIRRNYANSVKSGRFTQAEVDARMNLLSGSLSMDAFKDVDLVIEAVFEDMDLKKKIFAQLDGICRPGCIIATNTSYLNVNEIASTTKRPQDVVGMHFFSPANVMKLLEVVRGDATAKDVIATAMDEGRRIDKVPVLARVCHGFIGNRIFARRTEQMNDILLRNNVSPRDVDQVLVDFGFPLGPFGVSDVTGLDVGYKGDATPDKPTNFKYQLVVRGRRGLKTNAGFYDYKDGDRTPIHSPAVDEVAREMAAALGITRTDITREDIEKRIVYAMVNEASKVLEEGIALRASDIDVTYLHGYAFPRWRGGLMFYADQIGLANIVADLDRLSKAYDERLTPAPFLRKLAAEGRSFRDLDRK